MQNQESELNQPFLRRDRRYVMNLVEEERGFPDCPYLNTVNREVLDFGREKCCSVSLSKQNVYACLVCGRYFQGKDKRSPAYKHALKNDHHLFLSFETERFYCLPEDYEIFHRYLNDIRNLLHPRFSVEEINGIDQNVEPAAAFDGMYIPGMVELNIAKEFDFLNTIIHPLMSVRPVRDFFLTPDNYLHCKSELVLHFGELVRKMSCSSNCRRQVNPHEFVQTFMYTSAKKLGKRSKIYPVEYLSWFLSTLHKELRTSTGQSIIQDMFQGELQYTNLSRNGGDDGSDEVTGTMPFWILTLDLPILKEIFPTIKLSKLLGKFDGTTETKVGSEYMRLHVTRLPPYVIFHIRRFQEHCPLLGINKTPVELQVYNFDLGRIITGPHAEGMVEHYNLISNILQEGDPSLGRYNIYLKRNADELWYSIQEGRVCLDRSVFVEPKPHKWWRIQDIDLPISVDSQEQLQKENVTSESYMLIYERQL